MCAWVDLSCIIQTAKKEENKMKKNKEQRGRDFRSEELSFFVAVAVAVRHFWVVRRAVVLLYRLDTAGCTAYDVVAVPSLE